VFAVVMGCENSHSAPQLPPPPEIEVRYPVSKPVTEYEDFPGQTQALHTIEVRARVSGYLSKVYFQEGAEVKEGDPLFEIDPRPYEAELARTKANLALSEAHRKRLEYDYNRARKLLDQGALGREDYDKSFGDLKEAEAAVGVAKAQLQTAELNVGFTKVKATISGRISRRLIDPWNMVKGDDTPLTMIVSLDPIYAYFDVDEANALRLIRQGKIKALREKSSLSLEPGSFDVSLGLGDEPDYPHQGTIDFVDNQIDLNTGTLRMRGVFPNPDRLLSPGLFVRIRLPMGAPHSALLVSEQSLARDQGQKFVYVLKEVTNDKKEVEYQVEYRQVKVGRLYDGLREVTDGLKPGEKVVVSGMQRIRPNMVVNPKERQIENIPTPKPVSSPKTGVRSQGSGVRSQESRVRNQPSENNN
jgi:RND family efflux transporter MFP subunit